MKSTDFPQELRPFAKVFEKLAYRNGYSEVFDDLLTMIMCIFGRQTQEELYLSRASRYKPDELLLMSQLLGELMLLYGKCDTWTDPIGTFYEVIASRYKRSGFGQYFTPEPLCNMMVKLLAPTDNKPETVNDPACGSGRFLLATHFHSKGKIKCYAEDLDPVCTKMTCVNFLFHGVKGEVIQHNSLDPSSWIQGWQVNRDFDYTLQPSILPLEKENSVIMRYWESRRVEQIEHQKPSDERFQLSFDF